MASLGRSLQIVGLILAPLGLVHYAWGVGRFPEASLMNWELGLLFVGAICFLLGQRLARER